MRADPPWTAQLDPGGVCRLVNLDDGLSDADLVEVRSLWRCLNQTGALAPLEGVAATAGARTRAGRAWPLDAVAPVNAALVGVDLADGLAQLRALVAHDALTDGALRLWAEAVWGAPYPSLARRGTAGRSLDAGLLRPGLALLPQVSGALLDDDGAARGALADGLSAPALRDGLCTLEAVLGHPDPAVAAIATRALPNLGAALSATVSPENDRRAAPTGDSLRELLIALRSTGPDGRSAAAALRVPLGVAFSDRALGDRLGDRLAALADAGRLAPVPGQLLHLVSVDVDGGPLAPGEDDALTALLRLLARGDQPVRCSVDLGLGSLDVELGNLSVQLLSLLATQDPADVDAAVSLLGGVLGAELTASLLDLVADSGVCPALDHQLVADLPAIDRFNDGETDDLLALLIELLAAFDGPGGAASGVPALVTLASEAHARGLVGPGAELVRDLANEPLLVDLTELLPLVLDPAGLDASRCGPGAAPLRFTDGWAALGEALAPPPGAGDPLDALAPVVDAALDAPALWQLRDNLGALLLQPEAALRSTPALVAALRDADPEAQPLQSLADGLRDGDLALPVLRVCEVAPLTAAAAADGGPLPWSAGLVLDGTLGGLLERLADLTAALGAPAR